MLKGDLSVIEGLRGSALAGIGPPRYNGVWKMQGVSGVGGDVTGAPAPTPPAGHRLSPISVTF